MAYQVKVLGFGDNVVDKYEHIKTMYPGGNAVNFAVFAKKLGAERSAYMGIFGSDKEAEHVIASLQEMCIRDREREGNIMLAYTYVEKGRFELLEKPKPVLQDERDAIVKVTLASIC